MAKCPIIRCFAVSVTDILSKQTKRLRIFFRLIDVLNGNEILIFPEHGKSFRQTKRYA